jgi:hypothetical protein
MAVHQWKNQFLLWTNLPAKHISMFTSSTKEPVSAFARCLQVSNLLLTVVVGAVLCCAAVANRCGGGDHNL